MEIIRKKKCEHLLVKNGQGLGLVVVRHPGGPVLWVQMSELSHGLYTVLCPSGVSFSSIIAEGSTETYLKIEIIRA